MTQCRFLSLLALLLLPAFVCAATRPAFRGTAKLALQRFAQGTDAAGVGAAKTLYTGQSGGSTCFGMSIYSSDSTTHNVTIMITRGATNYAQVTIPLVAAQGSNGTLSTMPPLSSAQWLGTPTDSDGNHWFSLDNGDVLKAWYATTMVTGEIVITAQCADY